MQMWKSAVCVPNAYFDTSDGSFTVKRSLPLGFDVHTPPCFVQKLQSHARAGISVGSGSHVSVKATLPQWQLPLTSTESLRCAVEYSRRTIAPMTTVATEQALFEAGPYNA